MDVSNSLTRSHRSNGLGQSELKSTHDGAAGKQLRKSLTAACHRQSGFFFFFARFMESELELNDILQQMHVIATVPDQYHVLVELNTVRSLLQLLSHENTGRSDSKAAKWLKSDGPYKCLQG